MIEDCINTDFPALEETMQKEVAEREAADADLQTRFNERLVSIL